MIAPTPPPAPGKPAATTSRPRVDPAAKPAKISRAARWLTHPYLPLVLTLLAMLLATPSLAIGLQADDHFHRIMLMHAPPFEHLRRPAWHLFGFFDGGPVMLRWMMDTGVTTWWTNPALRIAFFRPISSLTHWLDYQLWPGSPALMHAQSVAWLGLAVLAASRLYRRIGGTTTAAGLAGLLYAVDHTHAVPVAFLANRNALIGTAFSILALHSHDRYRRDGWRAGAVATPLLVLVALCSAEVSVAIFGYFASYALFLDRAAWRARLLALAPTVVVGAGWSIVYRALGFGTSGSGLYLDPGTHPVRYLAAAIERIPILLLGAIGLPPADAYPFLPTPWARAMLAFALVALVATLVVVAPVLRHRPTARFWALGGLLATAPVAATFPNNRLLVMAGIGVMGVIAEAVVAVRDREGWLPGGPRAGWWRATARAFSATMLAMHVFLAPLLLAVGTLQLLPLWEGLKRFALSLPNDPALATQDLVLVNPPDAVSAIYLSIIRAEWGMPIPRRLRALAVGQRGVELRRVDDRTLLVRPGGGLLADWFSTLVRDPRDRMAVGYRVDLAGMSAEVTALTDDERPAEIAFRFERPLEDASLRWMAWRGREYVAWVPPRVGQSVTLAPQEVWMF